VLDREFWRFREFEAAGQLPQRVDDQRPAMREEVMALRLALGPVANVMDA
jgi:hypothetical protein